MLNPTICEKCNERAPTLFLTYGDRPREFTIALCEACYRVGPPEDIIRAKFTKLPPLKPKPKKTNIFVVVQIERQDEYYAHQQLKTPIAAFLDERNAYEFIERKRSDEYITLDWEVVPTPIEDLNAEPNVAS